MNEFPDNKPLQGVRVLDLSQYIPGPFASRKMQQLGAEIIKVEPGFVEACYGLAVDVGTTTCVGYLSDLSTGKVVNTESMMNPQVPYGEDVMSRITYAMSNPDGLQIMQKAIIDGLNEIGDIVARHSCVNNWSVFQWSSLRSTPKVYVST